MNEKKKNVSWGAEKKCIWKKIEFLIYRLHSRDRYNDVSYADVKWFAVFLYFYFFPILFLFMWNFYFAARRAYWAGGSELAAPISSSILFVLTFLDCFPFHFHLFISSRSSALKRAREQRWQQKTQNRK